EAYGPFAYVAANLIIDAIEAVGPDRAKVARHLKQTKNANTIIGPVEFDAHGQNTVPPISKYVSQDGKWVLWEDSEYASSRRATPVTRRVRGLAERVCVKPLDRSSPLMTLLATLSLGLVIRESVLIFCPRGADPKLFPQLLPQGGFEVGGVAIRYENLAILGIGLTAMVTVDLIIRRTRMGAAIRAVAQDPEAAQMMGVNLDRTVDATFFLGSGLAAVAAILSGLYYSEIHFIMGITGGVIGFSAAAIGGLGNVYGAIVGGLLFGVLQTTSAALIPRGSEFRDVVAFAVVMLFLVFKPGGIFGEKSVERRGAA